MHPGGLANRTAEGLLLNKFKMETLTAEQARDIMMKDVETLLSKICGFIKAACEKSKTEIRYDFATEDIAQLYKEKLQHLGYTVTTHMIYENRLIINW